MAVVTPSARVAGAAPADADDRSHEPSVAAASYLLAGGAFLALAALLYAMSAAQQISPNLLQLNAATSVGRLRPAAYTLAVYGGLGMLATGAAFEVCRRIGHTRLRLPLVATAAGGLHTLVVAVGALALLTGHTTGRVGLELPMWLSVPLAIAMLLAAVVVIRTLATRRDDELHPAGWFLAAGALAGPVLLILGGIPRVAGVNDAILTAFAGHGLLLVWLGSLGIGLALYAVPASSQTAIPSRRQVGLALSTWLLFAPLAGVGSLSAGPAQNWLESVGVAARIGLLIPALAILSALVGTYRRRRGMRHPAELRFALAGSGFLLAACAASALDASRTAGDLLHLTVFGDGLTELTIFGAIALLVASGVLVALPGVSGHRLANPALARSAVWYAVAGAALVGLSMLAAGYVQGAMTSEAVRTGAQTFTGAGWEPMTVALRPLLWLRVVGHLLLAAAWAVVLQQIFSTVAGGSGDVERPGSTAGAPGTAVVRGGGA